MKKGLILIFVIQFFFQTVLLASSADVAIIKQLYSDLEVEIQKGNYGAAYDMLDSVSMEAMDTFLGMVMMFALGMSSAGELEELREMTTRDFYVYLYQSQSNNLEVEKIMGAIKGATIESIVIDRDNAEVIVKNGETTGQEFWVKENGEWKVRMREEFISCSNEVRDEFRKIREADERLLKQMEKSSGGGIETHGDERGK